MAKALHVEALYLEGWLQGKDPSKEKGKGPLMAKRPLDGEGKGYFVGKVPSMAKSLRSQRPFDGKSKWTLKANVNALRWRREGHIEGSSTAN